MNLTLNCSLLASQKACQFVDKYCQYSVQSTTCMNKCESFDQPTCESSANSNYCNSFPSQCQQVIDCTTLANSDQCQANTSCQWNPPIAESCKPLQGNPLQAFCQNQNSQQTCQAPQCTYTPPVQAKCSYINRSCESNQKSCDENFCASCYSVNENNNYPCNLNTNEQDCTNSGCQFNNPQCLEVCNQLSLQGCKQNNNCILGCMSRLYVDVCSNQTNSNTYCNCQGGVPGSCNQVTNYCQTLQAKDCQSASQYCAYTAPVQGTCTNKIQCSVLTDQNSCSSQTNCSWNSYKCQTKQQMQCQTTYSQQDCTSSTMNLTLNCSLLASQKACQFVDKYCQYSVQSTTCNNKCESFDQPTCESSANSSYCNSFPSQCQQVMDCTTLASSDQCQANPSCQWNPPIAESCKPLQGNPLQAFCQNQNSQQTCSAPQCTYTPPVQAKSSYIDKSCENNQQSCDENFCASCYSINENNGSPCSSNTNEQDCIDNACMFKNGQCLEVCNQLSLQGCKQNKYCILGCTSRYYLDVCSNQTNSNKYCKVSSGVPGSCNQVNNYCQTLQAKDCQSASQYCAYTAPVQGTCTNKVQCSVLTDQNNCSSQKNCSWNSYKCQTKQQMQCQTTYSQQDCTSSSKFCEFSQSYQCTNKVEVVNKSSNSFLFNKNFFMAIIILYFI
ncbi:hypothetical protein ABPG74_002840 [Tetrahymena malaccensis]